MILIELLVNKAPLSENFTLRYRLAAERGVKDYTSLIADFDAPH
jgi:hypothetical protein